MKKQKKYFVLYLITAYVLILFNRCASIGTISGGPKDEDLPKMIGSKPKMYATNFNGKEIRIDFDEYVQLKDVNQQFNASPPLKKKPLIWIKNKTVIVEYTDTLKENTTYTFNFGNSISDLNEGNVYTNFEFVFSTGNFIDSLGIRGRIVNAFNLNPDKEAVLAELYSNLSDSAPLKEIPLFTGRTDTKGYFFINNVKPGTYRLYALKDKNYNYIYNPVTEAIAFSDSTVLLESSELSKENKSRILFPSDSLLFSKIKDTIRRKQVKDSIISNKTKNAMYADLYLFYEKDKKQYLKDYGRKNKRFFYITFNKPLKEDSINLIPVYYKTKDWYLIDKSPTHDSIVGWIKDTNLIKTDTLRTIIQYWGNNKKGELIWKSDTVRLNYSGTEKSEKKSNKAKPETSKVTTSINGTIDLNEVPIVSSEFPLKNIDLHDIQLFQKIDTVEFPSKFEITRDSLSQRKLFLKSKWIEQTNYKLKIFPGAFQNIYKIPYDTFIIAFSVQKLDYYGKLTVNFTGVEIPVIVQLLSNDKVEYEKYVTSNMPVVFDFVKPETYTLKAIFDKNGDKIWTTGNLLNKIQPEKVIFYKDEIKMRSNWDVNLEWNLK